MPDRQIFRFYVFGPSGLKDYSSATLRCKFDPFLSLDCARVEGSNFAFWQPWFQDERFYLPTSGWPMFGIKPLKGTVTRVRYDMVNAEGASRPPCILDFPKRRSDHLYQVGHCPNLVR